MPRKAKTTTIAEEPELNFILRKVMKQAHNKKDLTDEEIRQLIKGE